MRFLEFKNSIKIKEASDEEIERMSQQWVEGYGSEDYAYNAIIAIKEEIIFVVSDYCKIFRVACDFREQMQAMGTQKFYAWIVETFTNELAAAGWPKPHSDAFTNLTKKLVFKPLRDGVNPLDTLTEQIELGKDTPAKQWIRKIYDEFYEHPFNPRHRVMTWGQGDDQELAIFELATVFGKPTTVDIKWFQAYPQRQGIGRRAMQRLQQLAQQDGITLTLYPWNKGEISQSKLTKIYKGMGFQPAARGSKDMTWSPDQVKESLDQPYPLTWERSEYGDVDALAKLSDGTYLSIMFNQDGGDEWRVEFHRNNSQEVTGEGDSQRVFATVLKAIQQFIQKQDPWMLTFSADKEGYSDADKQSRVRLYDRMVKRYAQAWGYETRQQELSDKVVYELNRAGEGLDETLNKIPEQLIIEKRRKKKRKAKRYFYGPVGYFGYNFSGSDDSGAGGDGGGGEG
jgi:hypothetical protein